MSNLIPRRGLGYFVGLGLLGACAPELSGELESTRSDSVALPAPVVDVAAPAAAVEPDLILPEVPQPMGGYVVASFEGYADPSTGVFEIEMLDEQVVLPEIEAADLRTVDQALFCDVRVDADGTTGTGRLNTVEVVTETRTYGTTTGVFGLDEDCARPPIDNPGAATLFDVNGAFCAEVTVRSFYNSLVLTNVHSELYLVAPSAGHSGYAYPLGTGALPTGNLTNTFGLWAYGDIGVADGHMGAPFGSPPDEATRLWVFERANSEPFRFRGRIRAEFAEVCGDAVDNDCDGRVDEGGGCYADGLPCLEGIDCATGVCISGTCGIPVVPDFVMSNVTPVGGAGTTANGSYTMEVYVGAPGAYGDAAGPANRITVGPVVPR